MNRSSLLPILMLTVTGTVLSSVVPSSEQNMNVKRSFSDLGCMGIYDKAKFARLDRVCEECYQLFRESDVHTLCRSNCFKNSFFSKCVRCIASAERSAATGQYGGTTLWKAVMET